MHKDKKKEVTGKVLTDMPTDGAEAIIRIRKQTAYHLSGIKIRNIIQSNIEQLSERDKIEVLEYYTLFYSGGSGIRSMIMQHTKENNPSMYSTEKAHDDFVLDWIKFEISEIRANKLSSNTISTPKLLKTFPEYILHPDRERIAEALKTTFRGEKGTAIRLMIEVLKAKELITYENRQRTKIFDAMKLYFDWYIGRKQGIFDRKIIDETDYKAIETRVLHILKSIKNNK